MTDEKLINLMNKLHVIFLREVAKMNPEDPKSSKCDAQFIKKYAKLYDAWNTYNICKKYGIESYITYYNCIVCDLLRDMDVNLNYEE